VNRKEKEMEKQFAISEAQKIIRVKHGIKRSCRAIWRFIRQYNLGRRENESKASRWLVTADEIAAAAHFFKTGEGPNGQVRRGGRRGPTN